MTTDKRKEDIRKAKAANDANKRKLRGEKKLQRLDRWLTPNAWEAAVKAIEEEKLKD